MIDNDTLRYTVQLLLEWKTEAENETDLELTKEKKSKTSTGYDKIFRLIPALINEFKEDIEKTPLLREFILQGKGWHYNNSSGRKLLVYFFEDHEDLEAKIRLLENNNLINDITYNNTKRFVFTEEFVEILNNIDKYPVN